MPPPSRRERPKPSGTLKAYSKHPRRNQAKMLPRGRKTPTTGKSYSGVSPFLLNTILERANESSTSRSKSSTRSTSRSPSRSPARAGSLLDEDDVPEYIQAAIRRNQNPVDIVNIILARTGINAARKTELVRHVLAVYTPERLARLAPATTHTRRASPPRRRSPPRRTSPPRTLRAGRGGFFGWLFGR